jgi:hypothetical protein
MRKFMRKIPKPVWILAAVAAGVWLITRVVKGETLGGLFTGGDGVGDNLNDNSGNRLGPKCGPGLLPEVRTRSVCLMEFRRLLVSVRRGSQGRTVADSRSERKPLHCDHRRGVDNLRHRGWSQTTLEAPAVREWRKPTPSDYQIALTVWTMNPGPDAESLQLVKDQAATKTRFDRSPLTPAGTCGRRAFDPLTQNRPGPAPDAD